MSQPTVEQWAGSLNSILRAQGVTQHAFVCRRVQRRSKRNSLLEYQLTIQPNTTGPGQAARIPFGSHGQLAAAARLRVTRRGRHLVEVIEYSLAWFDSRDEQPLLRYERHAEPHSYPWHHLHVRQVLNVRAREAHLPTGECDMQDILSKLLAELA